MIARAPRSEQGVLIVGAGPSGLMMAHELARFNIPVRIIDKDLVKSSHSRAIAVQIRTLEIFSALGLAAQLLEKSHCLDAIEIYPEERPMIDILPVQTSSSFLMPVIVDQVHTERVLEDRLKQFGVVIERGVTLQDLTVTPTGVSAQLQTSRGELYAGPFAYVIGADGAHSLVRKKMAVSFFGTTYEDAFILADVQCRHDQDKNSMKLFFKNKKFFAMLPMFGDNHYRLISVRHNEREKKGPEPTLEEFQKLAAQIVPFPLKIEEAAWVSRFFVQCRSASGYQDGRLFLVGDAAHVHSPAGGQGMNTGLQDSFNLAFKLALILKNLSPESLALTYEQERKPVGDFLIKYTDRFFKFMVRSSLWARLLRRFVLPRLAHSLKWKSQIFRIGSQTSIRYEKGALVHDNKYTKLVNINIGERIASWPLINSHLHKTDLHQMASAHFFTCFIFLPANISKTIAQRARKQGLELAEKYEHFLQVSMIFGSDFDAEKIMGELDYSILLDKSHAPSTEPIFVITRTDHHVFCAGLLEELSKADKDLAVWYKAPGKP